MPKTEKTEGRKILDDVNKDVKAEMQAKKENTNMKKPIIITVLLTLITIASLGGMFVLGMNYNQSINDRVHNEAKALTSQASLR